MPYDSPVVFMLHLAKESRSHVCVIISECSFQIVALRGKVSAKAPVERRMSFVELESLRVPACVQSILGITWSRFLWHAKDVSRQERASAVRGASAKRKTSLSAALRTLSWIL